MQSPHWMLRLAGALALVCAGGCCCSRQPYGGYGGGVYAPQQGPCCTPGTTVPGGVYTAPGGTYTAPGGTYTQPGGPTFAPPYQNGTSQPNQWQQSPGTGNDAPFYNSETDGTYPGTGNGAVPRYGEPEELEPPPDGYNPGASYDSDARTDRYTAETFGAETVIQQAGYETDARDDDGAATSDGLEPPSSRRGTVQPDEFDFEPPINGEPTSDTGIPLADTQLAAVEAPNPFGYDRQEYRWLRGIAQFDDEDGSWHVMYNTTPDETDEFGGDITLVPDAGLRGLPRDGVVLVQGRVDYDSRDAYGKPRYRVEQLRRLVPQM